MHLLLNLLLVSWRQSMSLAMERKRAMWSSVSSVMPSPSSGHGAAIFDLENFTTELPRGYSKVY
jgi:hypothetical protein